MISVSIIITTKNEARSIANCLDSIKKQSYREIEIIVVDNNSSDSTKEIARKFTEQVFDFGPERSAQRNFGMRKAQGKYLLYLDADMVISCDLISECVESMGSQNLAGLYIPERIIGEGFWAKVRDFERSFYNATVIDCVRFVSKENFMILNGFDETMSGPEDWDFDRRIRRLGSVGITKNCLYHDESDFDLKSYLRKKSYYSNSFQKYIDKWGKNDLEIRKQLGATYRLFGVFIEQGKWVKMLKHPVLSIGMYFLRVLVGFNYLLLKKG